MNCSMPRLPGMSTTKSCSLPKLMSTESVMPSNHLILCPFRYDLNQIPYDYIVEVTNRFKGLYLTDREICMQVKKQQLELDMEQETGSKLGREYI